MPKSKEERARIARENGAKSKGPTTQAGKENSRMNAMRTGEHAKTISQFVPPESGILCHEDRKRFFATVHELAQIFQPVNSEAAEMVRQIAIARWTIDRLQTDINSIWNHELMTLGAEPAPVADEHADHYYRAQAALKLYSGKSPIERMERRIDQLETRIARLRRGIADIAKRFPTAAKPLETQPIEPKPSPEIEKNEPTVYVTETTPEVLAAYRREYPNHKIVVLPADEVAKGIEIKDDLPPAPRRAA